MARKRTFKLGSGGAAALLAPLLLLCVSQACAADNPYDGRWRGALSCSPVAGDPNLAGPWETSIDVTAKDGRFSTAVNSRVSHGKVEGTITPDGKVKITGETTRTDIASATGMVGLFGAVDGNTISGQGKFGKRNCTFFLANSDIKPGGSIMAAAPPPATSNGDQEKQRQAIEEERRKLAAERQQVAEAAAAAKERQQVEAEHQKLEAERQRLTDEQAALKQRQELEAERQKLEAEKQKLVEQQRVAAVQAAATPRAPEPPPKPAVAALDFNPGRYVALVIGNNGYKSLPKLRTAIGDAQAVAKVLGDKYGFEVTLLTDATRYQTLTAISKMRAQLKLDDNLLIYYAGHGVLDEAADRGYWLPVDAESDNPANWVSTADITDNLRAIDAKHVMIVADSCYSGTLLRGVAVAPRQNSDQRAWIKRMQDKRSRTALTSGGMEPVMDGGGSGHSVFTKAFLDALSDNTDVIDGQTLFSMVRRPVVLNAEQTPAYADMRSAGHDGGDFILVPKALR
ncbi:MAG TPA: caspase family protein [Candidatus Cybelea sp.]|nr:caspase family protein [Candidatus Cybelea sp.]